MPDAVENSGDDSAERTYAAATESAVTKADAAVPPEVKEGPAPLEFPAKPRRARAPQEAKAAAAAPVAPAPVAPTPIEAAIAEPTVTPEAESRPVAVARAPKPAVKAPVVKKAVAAKKPVVAAAKPAKAAKPKFKPAIKSNPILSFKETIMATRKTDDFTKTIKTAAADVQATAKAVFAKGSAVLGEASDFTKGNVDAVVSSGKILTAGLQDLGKTFAAEGKSAFETATADVKELAAVKSPSDFIRIQTTIVRRNLDSVFDLGAKNSEAVLKLASDAFAPISARASLAVEKFKKAA